MAADRTEDTEAEAGYHTATFRVQGDTEDITRTQVLMIMSIPTASRKRPE